MIVKIQTEVVLRHHQRGIWKSRQKKIHIFAYNKLYCLLFFIYIFLTFNGNKLLFRNYPLNYSGTVQPDNLLRTKLTTAAAVMGSLSN